MPARKTDKTPKLAGRQPAKRTTATGTAATTPPDSMVTGKVSPAKAAVGDGPVFAYIASLGKSTRGVELNSLDDLDERQVSAWMIQVAAVPGAGAKKR